MQADVYPVDQEKRLRKAGPTDLIRLLPAPGANPIFLPRWILEIVVYAIVNAEFMHLSGPSGSCKTALLEALHRDQENFASLCRMLNLPYRELVVYTVELVTYESPGELHERRALKDGTTYDEPSGLARAIEQAQRDSGEKYPLIWLREIGRVHNSMIQGGLLNLMTKGEVVLPGNRRLDCSRVAWVADSNYQAETDSSHELVQFDDALRRRFTVNLTMDYLSPEQEVQVLKQLMEVR